MLINSEKNNFDLKSNEKVEKKIKIKMSSPEPTSQTAAKLCLTFLLTVFLMFSGRK